MSEHGGKTGGRTCLRELEDSKRERRGEKGRVGRCRRVRELLRVQLEISELPVGSEYFGEVNSSTTSDDIQVETSAEDAGRYRGQLAQHLKSNRTYWSYPTPRSGQSFTLLPSRALLRCLLPQQRRMSSFKFRPLILYILTDLVYTRTGYRCADRTTYRQNRTFPQTAPGQLFGLLRL